MQDLTGFSLTGIASVQATKEPNTWYELGDKASEAYQMHEKPCDYCDYALGNHCSAGLALMDIMHGMYALCTHKF